MPRDDLSCIEAEICSEVEWHAMKWADVKPRNGVGWRVLMPRSAMA